MWHLFEEDVCLCNQPVAGYKHRWSGYNETSKICPGRWFWMWDWPDLRFSFYRLVPGFGIFNSYRVQFAVKTSKVPTGLYKPCTSLSGSFSSNQILYCEILLEWFFQSFVSPSRAVLEPLAQWDSPMQVKLSCWKPGLNTLLVELLPWALLVNDSQWDLWLFEGETIVLQIAAGKVIVPPNFKVGYMYNMYAK